MPPPPPHHRPGQRATEATDSICRQLCELSAEPIPDFLAMAGLAKQSKVVAQRLLQRANSPQKGLARSITKLQHAIVFLGASGVQHVSESILWRVDQAHDAKPLATNVGRLSPEHDAQDNPS